MKRAILCLFMSFLIFSCNSNDDSQPQTQEDDSGGFYALKVGNSWVYKYYNVNPSESINNYLGVTDSVSIVGTEEFNGELYYKFKSILSGTNNSQFFGEDGISYRYMRDSLGYLIDESGLKHFVNNSFDEFVYYTDDSPVVGDNAYAKLKEDTSSFNTEAGDFDCLEMNIRYIHNDSQFQRPFKNHIYYSDGIGLISKDIGFVNNDIWWFEIRLESYSIQE